MSLGFKSLRTDVSEHCLFHFHRWYRWYKQEEFFLLSPPVKMEQTQFSETSANKIQTPGNHTKERIRHSEHGESSKSRT